MRARLRNAEPDIPRSRSPRQGEGNFCIPVNIWDVCAVDPVIASIATDRSQARNRRARHWLPHAPECNRRGCACGRSTSCKRFQPPADFPIRPVFGGEEYGHHPESEGHVLAERDLQEVRMSISQRISQPRQKSSSRIGTRTMQLTRCEAATNQDLPRKLTGRELAAVPVMEFSKSQ